MQSDSLIAKAKLAEQAERYEDMRSYMHELININPILSEEERNLWSVANKNIVGARRSAWRILSGIAQKSSEKGEDGSLAEEYNSVVAQEIKEYCEQMIQICDSLLLEADSGESVAEEKTYYFKVKGDYYRYITEVTIGSDRETLAQKSQQAYESATEYAKELPATHPISLALALNFSVFYYEILNDSKEACERAKTAFDNAIAELDNLKDESYKDSTLIMQLLRDNLTLWTSENDLN